MLEHILALVLSGAASPWASGELAAHPRTLLLDVSGQRSSECAALRLDIPVREGGVIYFEHDGVRYEGVEAANGMIVLTAGGDRPLSLAGDLGAGGRWNRGGDGACHGTWREVR